MGPKGGRGGRQAGLPQGRGGPFAVASGCGALGTRPDPSAHGVWRQRRVLHDDRVALQPLDTRRSAGGLLDAGKSSRAAPLSRWLRAHPQHLPGVPGGSLLQHPLLDVPPVHTPGQVRAACLPPQRAESAPGHERGVARSGSGSDPPGHTPLAPSEELPDAPVRSLAGALVRTLAAPGGLLPASSPWRCCSSGRGGG